MQSNDSSIGDAADYGGGAMRVVRPLCKLTAEAHGDNLVINSRYTPTNFLWKNLLEQFGRPLNAYFLLVVALQFMSVIAPVNPMSTFLPLAFAFLLTAAKEGYDDYKRHQSDKAQNSRRVQVLRDYSSSGGGGGTTIVSTNGAPSAEWVFVPCKDLRVGDVVRLQRNDEIPADMVALSCPSDAHGVVYIRTDNMDGEIDLKPREVVPLAAAASDTPTATGAASPLPLSGAAAPNTTIASSTNNISSSSSAAPLVGRPPLSNTSMIAVTEGGSLLFNTNSPPQVIVDALRPFVVDVPAPTVSMDRFDARLLLNGNGKAPLSTAHLLPQSCYIKNTQEVVGLVVYTGKDTKAALNKSPPPVKWAKIDKDVSQYSKYIFIAQVCSAVICGVIGHAWSVSAERTHWYIKPPTHESAMAFIIYPLRFFLLTTVMIPISFKFVVDISKYFMAMMIEWDLNMWDEERGIGARVRNSGILEDLGQIEYILSDKTGTMTKNEMVLREVSIFGHRLQLRRGAGAKKGLVVSVAVTPASNPPTVDEVQLFWHSLAVCNSVEVEERVIGSGDYTYAAVSPDEEALCIAAAEHGQKLAERSKTGLRVTVTPTPFVHATASPSMGAAAAPPGAANAGAPATHKSLIVEQTFTFVSELKCMSVLVTDPDTNKSFLYCKGADDKLLSLISPAFAATPVGASRIAKVRADLDSFAVQGLRTLLVCYKEVPRDAVVSFNKAYAAALLEMDGRAERLLELRAGLECDLTLIGATAIEDCLQDGVAQTMSDLLDANIKVWMLTGDKVETAEQIALSCGLMAATDKIVPIYGSAWEATLRGVDNPPRYVRRNVRTPRSCVTTPRSGRSASASPSAAAAAAAPAVHDVELHGGIDFSQGTVLVVQGGRVLETILTNPDLRSRFVAISAKCKSVVCARVTPIQKAQVTTLVRRQGKLTLAIGDGGNDVAMIQAAHVGVGIVGREGKQAALASDFSFTKFKFIRSLLFVHGHQSYMRTAFVVQYSFYKSMLIAFIQILFNLWVTKMSGASFWDSLALTAWNGLYTLPQTIFFVFDRVAPRTVLEQNPFLYRLPQRGYGMTRATFFGHIAKGCGQSMVALWMIYMITADPFVTSNEGGTESASTTFLTVYSAFIWLQVLTVLLESNAIGIFNAIAIAGMPWAYYLISEAFYLLPAVSGSGAFRHSMTIPQDFAMLLICFTLYIPHLLYYVVQKIFFPTALDVLRHDEVSRLSQRGYIVSTSRAGKLWSKGIIGKLLLAGEIIARSFIIVEEPGEELEYMMARKREAKRARAASLSKGAAGSVPSAEVTAISGIGGAAASPSNNRMPNPESSADLGGVRTRNANNADIV